MITKNNQEWIKITNAYENNLKHIDLEIPRNKFIVFTGVSGSGKSSLAFNTIYAEGRRRYIESLNAYARQFLGGNEKPLVGKIENLSPAIAIDQKTRSHNPRSTVGTVTEIHDYARLLFAKIGTPFCINGHGMIEAVTIKEIMDIITSTVINKRIMILSPQVRDKKGTFQSLFIRLKFANFLRVMVDKQIHSLDEEIILDKNKRHNIDIVIDRVMVQDEVEIKSRLHDALEVALEHGGNLVRCVIVEDESEEYLFSSNYACKVCGFNISKLEPRLFSFNTPLGSCLSCKGIGVNLEIDVSLLFPDLSLSIYEGGIRYFKNFVNSTNIEWQKLTIFCNHFLIALDEPISTFTKKQMQLLIRGSDELVDFKIVTASQKKLETKEKYEGIGTLIERRFISTPSERHHEYYRSYLSEKKCHACQGHRLNPTALSVKINHKSIADLTDMNIKEALAFILNLKLTEEQQQIGLLILREISLRLTFLKEVGLQYLSLSRTAQTLSGGESQRIRLATQIGSQLTGVLYVLDEPSIGLHQVDNDRLLKTLRNLQGLGNTLILVEHDEDTIREADWVVDIGPLAGNNGGQITYSGPLDGLIASDTLTGQYLKGIKKIKIPAIRRTGNGLVLQIKNATANNLKNINVDIPLGKLVVITGVSGSGKSTLMNDVLFKGLNKIVNKSNIKPGPHEKIVNAEKINKIIHITQDPIGKTPRSNPATYTSVFDDIRILFSGIPESKIRGYSPGRFSFNVPGGRCEHCRGDGLIKINMQFLPTVYVNCRVCGGRRYNEETLLIRFKKKNIFDILEMTVAEALKFFENHPKIMQKLQTINDVGLDYIKLGQPAPSLSGGEAQRVKLSTYLLKKPITNTVFLLDEPTTGLHIDDVKKLLIIIHKIIDEGSTVIIIEHNLDIIKSADHIIDLGPEGGDEGGRVIVTGTPEEVAKYPSSYTGQYLQKNLYSK